MKEKRKYQPIKEGEVHPLELVQVKIPLSERFGL